MGLFRLLTLISAEAGAMFKDQDWIRDPTCGAAAIGFILVMVATVTVPVENRGARRQLDSELIDAGDLAQIADSKAGDANDPKRSRSPA